MRAHVRRKFHEAIVVDSGDSIAKTARNYCDKLFSIESELDILTSEERYNERLTQEKPVFEAFWSWAEKIAPTVLPKTQLGKAFEYAFKRREFPGNYFQDGDGAISNNAAENAIRPFTVGRKTGCSATRLKGREQVLISTVLSKQLKQTGLMFSNILSCC